MHADPRRHLRRALIALAALTPLATEALADPGDVSLGLKFGQTVVSDFEDDPVLSQVDVEGESAFGLNASYQLTPGLHIDLELVRGGSTFSMPGLSLDVDIDTTAVYAAYRSQGDLYLAGRIGYLRQTLDSDEIGKASESGSSLGFGAGYRVSPRVAVEVDYTLVEEDIDWLMASLRYRFAR